MIVVHKANWIDTRY